MTTLSIKTAAAFCLSMMAFSASAGNLYLNPGEDAFIRGGDKTHVYCLAETNSDRCVAADGQLAIKIFRDCRQTLNTVRECSDLVKKQFPLGVMCADYKALCYDDCRSGLNTVAECTQTCF
ncbi:MAG: hypothetical protein ABIR96_04845 [Bdellovibrionota bacterium]